MGAEQSALLVCTQTGKPEKALKLENAEQFFQLYFDRMPEPKTGPVTEALLHLILNAPPAVEPRELASWAHQQEQDSGYENDDLEMESVDSETSLESASNEYFLQNNLHNNDDSDFELIPLEFVDMQPIELLNIDDPQLDFEQEFIIRVADLNEDLS